LQDLTQEDFVRILTEPKGSLTTQYIELLKTEGIELSFQKDAIEKLATYAFDVNQTSQNIGARRLATIMERLLEELSFDAPDMNRGKVVIDAAYVTQRLESVTQDEDMSRFIL
jgi:ATP-dependent HslUV protease ATP-binding subunit HslU